MKKGFTLVELLAVIAILAILVIIALPNVMGMFNTAKENSFKTEIKEIYKTAEQTWINDAMFNSGVKEYSRCKSGCTNSLDLTGRSELEYYIKLNQSGEVIKYYATDGTFQYSYEGNGLSISDIESKGSFKKIAEITDENEMVNIEEITSNVVVFDSTFCIVDRVTSVDVPMKKNMTWKQFLDYVTTNYNDLDGFDYRGSCESGTCDYYDLYYNNVFLGEYNVNNQPKWYIVNGFNDVYKNINYIIDTEVIKDKSEGCYTWIPM